MTENINLSTEEIRNNIKAAIIENIGDTTPDAVVEALVDFTTSRAGKTNFRVSAINLVEATENTEVFSFFFNDLALTVATGTAHELKYIAEYHDFLEEEDLYQEEHSYQEFVESKGYEDGMATVQKPFTKITTSVVGEEYISAQGRIKRLRESLEAELAAFDKKEQLFYASIELPVPVKG